MNVHSSFGALLLALLERRGLSLTMRVRSGTPMPNRRR
jgi:hypothetical protein